MGALHICISWTGLLNIPFSRIVLHYFSASTKFLPGQFFISATVRLTSFPSGQFSARTIAERIKFCATFSDNKPHGKYSCLLYWGKGIHYSRQIPLPVIVRQIPLPVVIQTKKYFRNIITFFYFWIKSKLDCTYHFPIDLKPKINKISEFQYKIDHVSKTKNRKTDFSFVSAYYATFL